MNGDIDVLTVTLGLAGVVLLYSSIMNKNPILLIKAVLARQDPKTVPPLSQATLGTPTGPTTPGSVGGPPILGQGPNAAPDPVPGLPNGPLPYGGGTVSYLQPFLDGLGPNNGSGNFI